MEGETAADIALKCVNALELLPESTPSIKHLVDGKVYGRLITILNNEEVKDSSLPSLIPDLEALLKEHFAGPNLVSFEDVVSGSQAELTKLTVLLLYITMLTEATLRSRLVSSPLMDQSTQVKLKYLIESIQKRGSGMGTKFLDILCTEKLENKWAARCQTPVSSRGSPKVYSSSPKTSASPLRDLVQSPPFRLQKILNAKMREVNQLNQQINNMENDRQEMEMKMEFADKKISKLKNEVLKLQTELKDHRKYRDELEAKMIAGDDLVQQQLHQLGQESSLIRKENMSLQETVNRVQEDNDELTTKNESLKKRLLLVSTERDRLQEEMSTLYRAKLENENIIESQAYDLKEMKTQLEELRQHLLEFKPGNRTIEESFEGNSPMNFTESSPIHSGTCGENMADAVVEKILFETQEQLNHLQEQHVALQENLTETTYSRDQLLAQVECVTTEHEKMTCELKEIRETSTQLQNAHKQICDENQTTLKLLQNTQVENQKLEAERQRLENEAQQTNSTVSNLKAELCKFVDQLSECSSQLKIHEHQLELSRQEKELMQATLQKVSEARDSLEKEFSAKEFKMKEEFQQQIQLNSEGYEQQAKELTRNLSTVRSEWETLTQEKTSLKLEIQNLTECLVSAKQKMEEMTITNANLDMQIHAKSEAISDMQHKMETELKVLNEEKCNLQKEIEMKDEEYFKLKCDIEIKEEQIRVEKAAHTKEILSKEAASASLTDKMEKTLKTYSDEKARFDVEIKAKEEAFLSMQNEKEKELEIQYNEVSKLNEIIRTKEEDFMQLKKEMNESVQELLETKTTLSKELQLKEESYIALKQKMEGKLVEFTDENNELKNAIQQKEIAYNQLQIEMQEEKDKLDSEKTVLIDEIQAKEGACTAVKQKMEGNLVEFTNENNELKNAIQEKELAFNQFQMKMQEEKDKLDCEKTVLIDEVQAKEGAITNLRKDYDSAIESYAQEKSLLTNTIRVKEEALVHSQEIIEKLTNDVKVRKEEYNALQQQLETTKTGYEQEKNALVVVLGEKATLDKKIQEREESFITLQNMLQESADKYSSEKEAMSQELQSKLVELSHLQEEISKVRDEWSSSVNLLTKELEKTKSEYEAQREYNNKLSELGVTVAEKCKHIDFIEKEKECLKNAKDEMENIYNKQLHSAKLALEALQREKEGQTQSNEKTICELHSSLAEKTNLVSSIEEDCKQSRLTYKSEMDEMKAEISSLTSALLEKEEEFKTKVTILREQMEVVEAEKARYESKVAEVTDLVDKMEEEHKATLDHLKFEAEEQQIKFDVNISDLKDKVSSLESDKIKTVQQLEEQALKVKALVSESKNETEARIKAEAEKEKAVELHEQEKSSMESMIKTLEDALNALQEQVKVAFETHGKEKVALTVESQEKEVVLASLKKDIENHLAAFSVERASLSKETQQKEDIIQKQKQDIQNLLTQMNEEKALLSKEIELKENGSVSLKHEMESAIDQLTDKMKKELQEKEELILSMQKERENSIVEHAKEKASMNGIVRQKEEALSSLHCTLQSVRDAFTSEKETLQKELQNQQESYTVLKDKYEKAQESQAVDTNALSLQIQEKEKEMSYLREEAKSMQEKQIARIEQLGDDLGKMTARLETEQKLNVDQNCEILALKEEIAVKDTEHIKNLTETQQKLSDEISRLNNGFAEKTQMYESHQKQKEEEMQRYKHEVLKLKESAAEKIELMASLEQEMIDLKEHKESIFEEMNNNITEKTSLIRSLKDDINNIQNTFTQKEKQMLEELSSTKNDLEMIRKEKKKQDEAIEEKISSLNQCISEKSTIISTLKQETQQIQSEREALQSQMEQRYMEQQQKEGKTVAEFDAQLTSKSEAVNAAKKELEQLQSCHEVQLGKVNDAMKTQEARMKGALNALENKLTIAQEEVRRLNLRVRAQEAKLIDKEQEICAAREEVMLVERETEKSSRSSAEELKAMKDKFKSEKKVLADKMKVSYRTEIEKLMAQIEEHEHLSKEKQIIYHKYEAAKKKLTEVFAKLEETKTINEGYEKQMIKYKELVSRLQSNLQKESSKQKEMLSQISDLESIHQPLKEKLQKSENTVRRMGNEKRSLEVQLMHAAAQMKEIKKQWGRESFGGINTINNTLTRGSHTASSDSRLSEIVVTRPSSSSCEDDWNVDDSTQELLPSRSSKGTRKTMPRATSADTVFRKPSNRISHAENKQSCENVTQATGAMEKKTVQPPKTHVSDKSLGRSVPRDMFFNCEDEEELFSNKYLLDMKVGHCNPLGDAQWKRLSELQRRNSLYPPHMRSAYPAEMQFASIQDFEDDKLRDGCAVDDRHLLNLTQATENLILDSPAYNLRKRKSLTDSECSFGSSGGRKAKRLSTSYSRPGPPTPGRKSLNRIDKENRRASSASDISLSSLQCHRRKASPQSTCSEDSPVSTRLRHARSTHSSHAGGSPSTRSPLSTRSSNVTVTSKKGSTPRGKRGMTPSSLRKILSKGKSPWRKLDNEQETPKVLGDSTGSSGSSKLRIFRRPFGSRNYSVLSASLRSQENPGDLNDLSTASIGHSNPATTEKKVKARR